MQNRRQFIRRSLQGVALVGIIGLSGALIFRNKEGSEEECNFDFICQNCKQVKSCQIREAKKFRKTQSL